MRHLSNAELHHVSCSPGSICAERTTALISQRNIGPFSCIRRHTGRQWYKPATRKLDHRFEYHTLSTYNISLVVRFTKIPCSLLKTTFGILPYFKVSRRNCEGPQVNYVRASYSLLNSTSNSVTVRYLIIPATPEASFSAAFHRVQIDQIVSLYSHKLCYWMNPAFWFLLFPPISHSHVTAFGWSVWTNDRICLPLSQIATFDSSIQWWYFSSIRHIPPIVQDKTTTFSLVPCFYERFPLLRR